MATNLRLRAVAEQALREEAARTGRSQQDLIRVAVDRYLRLEAPAAPRTAVEALLAGGTVLPARAAYRELDRLIPLPEGSTTTSLLDRDERS